MRPNVVELEESIRRQEEEERRREEERRGEELEAEVARWRRAQDIRSYVEAALEMLGDADPVGEARSTGSRASALGTRIRRQN